MSPGCRGELLERGISELAGRLSAYEGLWTIQGVSLLPATNNPNSHAIKKATVALNSGFCFVERSNSEIRTSDSPMNPGVV